ncbi:MAG: hypothetical protein IJQ26_02790, partial [Lachnospiraceae bacterium]|nr:hypothetical protein [Lachnospiraceae bacterium]
MVFLIRREIADLIRFDLNDATADCPSDNGSPAYNIYHFREKRHNMEKHSHLFDKLRIATGFAHSQSSKDSEIVALILYSKRQKLLP